MTRFDFRPMEHFNNDTVKAALKTIPIGNLLRSYFVGGTPMEDIYGLMPLHKKYERKEEGGITQLIEGMHAEYTKTTGGNKIPRSYLNLLVNHGLEIAETGTAVQLGGSYEALQTVFESAVKLDPNTSKYFVQRSPVIMKAGGFRAVTGVCGFVKDLEKAWKETYNEKIPGSITQALIESSPETILLGYDVLKDRVDTVANSIRSGNKDTASIESFFKTVSYETQYSS